MASLDSLLVRAAKAEKSVRRTTEAYGVPIRIKSVGIGTGTSGPLVEIDTHSSNLKLTDVDDVVVNISFASTYTTLGTLADKINSYEHWECKILDGLRSDASDNMMANGSVTAATVNGESVFDLLQLIASAKLEVRVTYDETVGNLRPAGSHRVTLNAFSIYATCTGGANTIKIYECDNASKTETQIWQGLGVNNTLLAYSPSSTTYPFGGITAKEGHDLVIVVAGTVTTAATTNYLQAEFIRE